MAQHAIKAVITNILKINPEIKILLFSMYDEETYAKRFFQLGVKGFIRKDASTDAIQISMEQRRDIYLIFKEAINNAVKYAHCYSIHASITKENNHVQMRISDDGNGFDTNIVSNGNGLTNMKKRAEINGGHFEIKSSAGGGTEVVVSFKA